VSLAFVTDPAAPVIKRRVPRLSTFGVTGDFPPCRG